ncbi:MAG: hypothetical protein ACYDD0_02725 [Candidatus Dormibacteria bacterium]
MRGTARELVERGPTVSVGVLSADLLRLGEALATVDDAGIRTALVDVMDGVFCHPLTVGSPLVRGESGSLRHRLPSHG